MMAGPEKKKKNNQICFKTYRDLFSLLKYSCKKMYVFVRQFPVLSICAIRADL